MLRLFGARYRNKKHEVLPGCRQDLIEYGWGGILGFNYKKVVRIRKVFVKNQVGFSVSFFRRVGSSCSQGALRLQKWP